MTILFRSIMAKVNDKEDTAWAITIDMKRAPVEAMAPFFCGSIRSRYNVPSMRLPQVPQHDPR
jgi:hypothetical protein